MIKTIIFLAIVALIGGYWYWTTTPSYSIYQVRNAIVNRDVEQFKKYVDTESIANDIVDALVAKPIGILQGFGAIGQIFSFGLTSMIKPPIVDSVKSQIENLVEQGGLKQPKTSSSTTSSPQFDPSLSTAATSNDSTQTNQMPGFSLKKILKRFGFTGKVFQGIQFTNTNGQETLASIDLYNQKYAQDLFLQFRMRSMGGYWRIDHLSNLIELLDQLVKLEHNYQHQEKPGPVSFLTITKAFS